MPVGRSVSRRGPLKAGRLGEGKPKKRKKGKKKKARKSKIPLWSDLKTKLTKDQAFYDATKTRKASSEAVQRLNKARKRLIRGLKRIERDAYLMNSQEFEHAHPEIPIAQASHLKKMLKENVEQQITQLSTTILSSKDFRRLKKR
jgi:hypothetical protein